MNAVEGISLLAGDRCQSRGGMARLDLPGGSKLYMNRTANLRLLTGKKTVLVDLQRGEIFVEEVASPRVHIETTHGFFSPVGTRFGVQHKFSRTIVRVEEGAVEARAKSKTDRRRFSWVGRALRVEAGFQAQIRLGNEPRAPTRIRVADFSAWTHVLTGQTVLFGDAFSGERLAGAWRAENPALVAPRGGELRIALFNPRGWRARMTGLYTRKSFALAGGLQIDVDMRVEAFTGKVQAGVHLTIGGEDSITYWATPKGLSIGLGKRSEEQMVKTWWRVESGLKPAQKQHIRITVTPRNLALAIDGKVVHDGPHDLRNLRLIAIGLLGISSRYTGAGVVIFDNLKVSRLRKP